MTMKYAVKVDRYVFKLVKKLEFEIVSINLSHK